MQTIINRIFFHKISIPHIVERYLEDLQYIGAITNLDTNY